MSAYQDKLEELKQLRQQRIDADRAREEARKKREAQVAQENHLKRVKEREEAQRKEQERQNRLAAERERNAKAFRDLLRLHCGKKLDEIQATGKFEICETKMCGYFRLCFSPPYSVYSGINMSVEEYAGVPFTGKTVSNKVMGKRVKKSVSEIVEIDIQDPRVNSSVLVSRDHHIRDDEKPNFIILNVYHGDPEEWAKKVEAPVESMTAHMGGYREVGGGYEEPVVTRGAPPVTNWWEEFCESVSQFFLKLGFFGGEETKTSQSKST